MTGAIGGVGAIGGIGAIGGVVGVGASVAAPAVTADAISPSTTVSLGQNTSPTMFGNSSMTGVNAYSAVQSLDGASLNINHIAQQTGLSTDFVNGFVAGVGMSEQTWADKLTDALILMLLLEKINKQ